MRRLSLALAAALALAGCAAGGSYELKNTNSDPAATGHLDAEESSGNTHLALSVQHLAKPDKVVPGAKTYVVWVAPSSGDKRPQNVGQLQVDDNLQGALNTLTPYKSFDLFVTPERDGAATAPSGPHMLETTVGRP